MNAILPTVRCGFCGGRLRYIWCDRMKLCVRLAAVCLAAFGVFGLCGCGKVRSIVSVAIQEDAFDEADKKRLKKMESECAELLAQYPDDDGWCEKTGPGDIPFLADREYISGCEKLDEIFFKVSTPEELASACWYVNTQGEADISLCCDIDLSGYQWAPMGWKERAFTGKFYGNGHTISDMKILRPNKRCDVGFIGYEIRCTLSDVTFDGAEISVKDYGELGVAVANCIGGTIENVVVRNSSITGKNAGAVIGWDASDSITDCSFENVTVNGQPCENMACPKQRDGI